MTLPLFVRATPAPDPRNVLLAKLARAAGRPHLAAWILEGADVEALKEKAIKQIEAAIGEGGPWKEWNDNTNLGNNLVYAARSIHAEYFRTIDWLVTQMRNGKLTNTNVYDMAEFVNRYLGPVLMNMRAKNLPWPQLKSKEFDWETANQFVEEHADMLGDSYGPYNDEDSPVFDLGNGWRIVQLPADNVETEGQEMNNCLKDNDQYHWTDKTENRFISVLSLRDPLNRPHVSASVRYDDWQAGNLIYTEGPLLKNNRPLAENEEYSEMWSRFENWVRERGGQIGRGSDDWQDEEEEAEPYHNDGYDTTEYGDYLSVEDLADLCDMWTEAKRGANDWGQREPEQRDDHDMDGDPYYYYETYGGREVGSTDSGLEQAVEEWMDDVEACAGTAMPMDLYPQDFVGAVVLWATMLQDAVRAGGQGLLQTLSAQLSERVTHPSDPNATNEARAMLMWASQQIISEHSLTAVHGEDVPFADSDQRRLNWQAFAPPEPPPEDWGEMAELPRPIHPEQLEVEPQPQTQQGQPPQVQGDPAGFRPLTEAERIHATTIVGAEWENNQTPENLNMLASWLMSTYPHTSPEEATRLLGAVTGQQVGFRQAKVVHVAEDESESGWYENWQGPEEAQPTYGDHGPSEGVPRFAPGEHVKMMNGNYGGDIVGDPVDSFEGRAYYVNTYDKEGPVGVTLWNESLLHRPDRYDEPGESTLQDWFGISPEGEEYFRQAKLIHMGTGVPADHPGWTPDCPECGSQDTYESNLRPGTKYRCNGCGNYFGFDNEMFVEDFGEPWSPVPKYQPGERVVFRGGQGSGTVHDEPEVFEGSWWYRVMNDEGQVFQAPEEAILRPEDSDQPTGPTLEALGIPPEGEQYYRSARRKTADEDYRGGHTAPSGEPGSSMDDPTSAFGGDEIYGPNALHYYGSGGPSPTQDPETQAWARRSQQASIESLAAVQEARGNPDHMVAVYRAVPSEVAGQINPGDWVTPSRTYAEIHGESNLGGYRDPSEYKVLSAQVRAGDLYTDGDLSEWGWVPQARAKTSSDEWDEMFEKKPVNIDPRKPYPFIYSPSAKWIKWGSENGGHGEVENSIVREGERVPDDAYFGRWFPDNGEVYIYDEPFKKKSWRYQQAVMALINVNAPR